MKIKEQILKIHKDYLIRTILFSTMSSLTTIAFALYNFFVGFLFGDAFSLGIATYYSLLLCIRLITILVEKRISSAQNQEKNLARINNYKIATILVFIMDLAIIAPIILMVVNPKDFKYGLIPAIAMAAYSTYKITLAIYNYIKSKKSKNPTIILLREINVIGAIMSILSLQRVLIMVNGGMNDQMRTLSFITSIAFIAVIILFSIFSYIKNQKIFKNIYLQNSDVEEEI